MYSSPVPREKSGTPPPSLSSLWLCTPAYSDKTQSQAGHESGSRVKGVFLLVGVPKAVLLDTVLGHPSNESLSSELPDANPCAWEKLRQGSFQSGHVSLGIECSLRSVHLHTCLCFSPPHCILGVQETIVTPTCMANPGCERSEGTPGRIGADRQTQARRPSGNRINRMVPALTEGLGCLMYRPMS